MGWRPTVQEPPGPPRSLRADKANVAHDSSGARPLEGDQKAHACAPEPSNQPSETVGPSRGPGAWRTTERGRLWPGPAVGLTAAAAVRRPELRPL